MSVKGPNSNSLSQAVADLEAMDARLAALVAAYPRAEAGGPDLAAPIRESRELIRTIVELLAGAQSPNGLPNEAPEQAIGGAKRRVKIKAASETTAGSGAARVEAAARSGAAAGKASAKAATRGGDGAGSASAATAAATATAKAPPNSLLARLGAATPEPGALPPRRRRQRWSGLGDRGQIRQPLPHLTRRIGWRASKPKSTA